MHQRVTIRNQAKTPIQVNVLLIAKDNGTQCSDGGQPN
jgi:hypothetical protein